MQICGGRLNHVLVEGASRRDRVQKRAAKRYRGKDTPPGKKEKNCVRTRVGPSHERALPLGEKSVFQRRDRSSGASALDFVFRRFDPRAVAASLLKESGVEHFRELRETLTFEADKQPEHIVYFVRAHATRPASSRAFCRFSVLEF